MEGRSAMEDFDQIRHQLEDGDAAVRVAAVAKLAQVPGDEARGLLARALEDPDAKVRFAALGRLADTRGFRSTDLLMPLIEDDSEAIRVAAVVCLGRLGDSSVAPRLLTLLEGTDPADAKLRATLVQSLGNLCGMESVARLTPYLQDENDRVRANAVEAIDAIYRTSFEPLVATHLTDSNNRVRGNAVVALWRYVPKRCLEVLRDMVASESKWFRLSAVWAAGETGAPEALDTIAPLVDDADADVRILVIKTFARHYRLDVRQLLERAANDDDTTVAYYARKAIDAIHGGD